MARRTAEQARAEIIGSFWTKDLKITTIAPQELAQVKRNIDALNQKRKHDWIEHINDRFGEMHSTPSRSFH